MVYMRVRLTFRVPKPSLRIWYDRKVLSIDDGLQDTKEVRVAFSHWKREWSQAANILRAHAGQDQNLPTVQTPRGCSGKGQGGGSMA